MALPKIAEARELNDQALEEAIVATKRRLFDLRFQKAIRKLETGFHQFKHERHRLAQLMTVQRERFEIAMQAEAAALSASEDTQAQEPAPTAEAVATATASTIEEE